MDKFIRNRPANLQSILSKLTDQQIFRQVFSRISFVTRVFLWSFVTRVFLWSFVTRVFLWSFVTGVFLWSFMTRVFLGCLCMPVQLSRGCVVVHRGTVGTAEQRNRVFRWIWARSVSAHWPRERIQSGRVHGWSILQMEHGKKSSHKFLFRRDSSTLFPYVAEGRRYLSEHDAKST